MDGPAGPAFEPPAKVRKLRRRRYLAAAVVVAASLLAGVLVVMGSVDTRKAPLVEMEVASHAVIAAGTPEVRLWAPNTVHEAEAAFARGRAIQDGELSRPLPVRDFRPASAAFDEAHELALEAMRSAVRDRRAANGNATKAIEEAELALADATHIVQQLGTGGGDLLLSARVALEQARIEARARDYRDAVSAAVRARTSADAAASRLLSRVERYRDPRLVRQWKAWEEATYAASRRTGRRAIIIVKERNELVVIERGRVIAKFHADMGRNVIARKLRAGDAATPEGQYRITEVRDVGRTKWYRALMLDYPTHSDRERLRHEVAAGRVPAGSKPGNLIEIHGDGGRGKDWTDGCVALRNSDMDRLFRLVGVGTPVTIIGGHGSDGKFSRMLARAASGKPSKAGA